MVILDSMIGKIHGEIERYVLISFDSDRFGHVNEIKGIVPAKGLDYYKEELWTSYVTTPYAPSEGSSQESTDTENAILLQRKPRIRRVKREEERTKQENE